MKNALLLSTALSVAGCRHEVKPADTADTAVEGCSVDLQEIKNERYSFSHGLVDPPIREHEIVRENLFRWNKEALLISVKPMDSDLEGDLKAGVGLTNERLRNWIGEAFGNWEQGEARGGFDLPTLTVVSEEDLEDRVPDITVSVIDAPLSPSSARTVHPDGSIQFIQNVEEEGYPLAQTLPAGQYNCETGAGGMTGAEIYIMEEALWIYGDPDEGENRKIMLRILDHEAGHTFGLGHPTDGYEGNKPVMAKSINPETDLDPHPQPDSDLKGANCVYGSQADWEACIAESESR